MFTDAEWCELLETLNGQTQTGEIGWIPKNGTYQHRIDEETVLALRSIDGDARAPFDFTVWRSVESDGKKSYVKFGTISSDTDSERWGNFGGGLDDLFTTISRQMSGAPSLFENIMSKLGKADKKQ